MRHENFSWISCRWKRYILVSCVGINVLHYTLLQNISNGIGIETYSFATFFVLPVEYREKNMEEDCLTPEPSPFLVACVVGVLDVVVKHRTKDEAMLNARNSWSCSGLHLACKCEHINEALTLLEKGPSVNVKDKHSTTPLHFAVTDEYEALVRMLLEAGARVESRDNFGLRPLSIAVYRGSIPLVRMLLDFHANPNVDYKSRTCLEDAILYRQDDIVQLLREAGATGSYFELKNI